MARLPLQEEALRLIIFLQLRYSLRIQMGTPTRGDCVQEPLQIILADPLPSLDGGLPVLHIRPGHVLGPFGGESEDVGLLLSPALVVQKVLIAGAFARVEVDPTPECRGPVLLAISQYVRGALDSAGYTSFQT
jgi:hypothetical protein